MILRKQAINSMNNKREMVTGCEKFTQLRAIYSCLETKRGKY